MTETKEDKRQRLVEGLQKEVIRAYEDEDASEGSMKLAYLSHSARKLANNRMKQDEAESLLENQKQRTFELDTYADVDDDGYLKVFYSANHGDKFVHCGQVNFD